MRNKILGSRNKSYVLGLLASRSKGDLIIKKYELQEPGVKVSTESGFSRRDIVKFISYRASVIEFLLN